MPCPIALHPLNDLLQRLASETQTEGEGERAGVEWLVGREFKMKRE